MAFYDVLSISDWVLIILCGWVGGRRGIYDFLLGGIGLGLELLMVWGWRVGL